MTAHMIDDLPLLAESGVVLNLESGASLLI